MKTQVKNAGERAQKLLDQVRNLMRLQHYSIHTERSYVDWIRRFVRFHRMETRADLENGGSKIETFLNAVWQRVAGVGSRAIAGQGR